MLDALGSRSDPAVWLHSVPAYKRIGAVSPTAKTTSFTLGHSIGWLGIENDGHVQVPTDKLTEIVMCPPERRGWCYIDKIIVDRPDTTPQLHPIPRFV
jgi:hypothetical protein